MNQKKIIWTTLALATVTLTLASCNKGPKGSWHLSDYDYLDETAAAPAVATAGEAVNFVASSYEDRTEILGKLETYAMKNNLTGITLYDDGGYGKYNDRVKFPTNPLTNADGTPVVVAGTTRYDYVSGYGFGVIGEGYLDGELSGVSSYKTYYHTFETEDPKTLNYMNDKGSVVGSYHGYVAGAYFDIKLSETKDSYDWFPSLATEDNVVDGKFRPIPLDAKEGSNLATTYRIYVRTGAAAKYGTATTNAKLTKYNGREVALEDYVTPIRELHIQKNGMARGAEDLTGANALVGMNNYYNGTAAGHSEELWASVGLKTGTDDKGSYLDFTFVTPCAPFYAMYYLSSSLSAPIPAEFLEDIGGIKNWGSFNEDTTLTPVDTTLSSGPYVVEAWNADKEFVFKRNDQVSATILGGEHRYKIPGVHVNILAGATTDPLLAFNEWSTNKLDAVGIPKDKIKTEVGTKGTQQTKGSSTTKLNVNTCTAAEWEALFGENGSICQTPKSAYWDLKPAMSNDDFLRGINHALNRTEYAQNHGVTPSINYFSDNYLSNPEEGISYNSTQEHKDALLAVYGSQEVVNKYGYDKDLAIESFKKAADTLLASGAYKAGDKIEIEIAWQAEAQIENNGAEIKSYLETAFNDPAVCGNKLTLEVKNMAVAVWSDVYYKKMMVGQFDIGFGGISGNTLNPLNFMEVLKSDNSSGFTLNWGPNTNDPADLIQYKGKGYTYDALFQAADTGTVVASDGTNAKLYGAVLAENTVMPTEKGAPECHDRKVRIKVGCANIPGVVNVEVLAVVVCWYEGEYDEAELEFTVEGDEIIAIVPAEIAEAYQGAIGFDIYYSVQVGDGAPTTAYTSLYSEFPRFE